MDLLKNIQLNTFFLGSAKATGTFHFANINGMLLLKILWAF